jgi:hypothetical protein
VGVLGFSVIPSIAREPYRDWDAYMPNDKQYSRLEVGEIATAMIEGTMRPLLGARMLMQHLHTLKDEVEPEIFRLFQGVDSESDSLPIGPERNHWGSEALLEKDAQASAYELQCRDQLLEAARHLVLQFPRRGPSSL